MTIPKSSFKSIALMAARAGDSKKASPVTVYDLAGTSPLADYAVLMVVESAPQLDAAEEEVLVKLKQEGFYCLHKDGMRSKNWKVLDYGGTLVHIYDQKASEFYAIDKIYDKCKQVPWEDKPAPAAAPAPKTAEVIKEAKPPAVKKAAVKKAPAKKAKPAAKKSAVKKPAVKKAPAKKAPAKKAKPALKKTAVKKAKPAKKAAPKKAAKKTAKKK
jgi:ribosome-associated protein